MSEGPENPFAPPGEHADVPFQRTSYEQWNLATLGQRFGGWLIDSLLAAATAIPGVIAYSMYVYGNRGIGEAATVAEQGEAIGMMFQYMGLIFIGPLILGIYQWYLITKTGQTGELPGFVYGVLLRNWLFVFAGLIPYVGGCIGLADAIAIFFGDRRQCLHDRVAGTIVVAGQ
jgi:hypothetical protein